MHPINYSLCLFIICLHIEKLKIDTLRFILTKEQLFQEQHKSFRKEKKWCWKSYYSKHLLSLAFEVKSGMLISLQNMNSMFILRPVKSGEILVLLAFHVDCDWLSLGKLFLGLNNLWSLNVLLPCHQAEKFHLEDNHQVFSFLQLEKTMFCKLFPVFTSLSFAKMLSTAAGRLWEGGK